MNVFEALKLSDLFSLLNAMLGFGALLAAHNGESFLSASMIVLAAISDGIDGVVARRNGPGYLGENLDSLADLVSFGAAPALLVVTTFNMNWEGWILGGFYLICSILRLARYVASEKNDQFFEGLPVPAAGMILAASVLLGTFVVTLPLMLIISILMISSIYYPKIRDFRVAATLGLLFLIIAFIFGSQGSQTISSFYADIILIIIITAYLLSPAVISLRRIER
ncbi:MAG: CDP-diacylglycerol--serine O-phosphatidyltransferase [Methanotrichaceae archaeon]|nr:CDP-diacylglycerol--serine O-phosphatidyltransferase [Methanotrichaceae archaeon]